MRISDWSSDVCSSDLSSRARTIRPIRTRSASCGRQSQRCKGVRRMNEMTELASICTSDLTQTAGLGTGPVSCEPYRSPAYFERERENLFKRAWLRSEEHTSELQSLMRISYAVFCLTKKKCKIKNTMTHNQH